MTADVVGRAHYCWNGTDDYAARRNMSCLTGQTSLGNVLSTKGYPTPETVNPSTDKSQPAWQGYFCMMFEYYISTESVHEDTETIKTKEVFFSCDTENLCKDASMFEGYEASYKGHQGNIYCCNSNNCNTQELLQGPEHEHTCVDAIRDQVSWKGATSRCPKENTPCLRERLARTSDSGVEEFIEERLSCDNLNNCAVYNLTRALGHSCKIMSDRDTNLETEICCCKGDNCFIPDWFSFDHHQSGNPGQAQQPRGTNWQRTLLICLGVALAFLAVFVSVCFLRRTMAVKKQQQAELSRLAYKVVQSEGLDDPEYDGDSVKILPANNR